MVAPSGVGIESRFLAQGLIDTGRYSFRCLGGAIKHGDYSTVTVNPDFVIKPVDGFGSKELIRSLLYAEQPDALLIFTDPRQFIWLYEMEDEIHQICPILYWHIWDNGPYPQFNYPVYEATDLLNCISYKTYELVKPHFPDKTNYITHTFPKHVYFPMPEEQVKQLRQQNFGPRADWFIALWVNRNATRKMPGDILDSWKLFLEKLEKKHGHKNAVLIMHTDPGDPEGPNIIVMSEMLGLQNNVWFSAEKLDFERMNVMHNMADTCINISKNEGFGLSTLAQMMVGKPIVTLCTGGETRQVIDYRDGSENGVAIQPSKRSLVGSQLVPYIFEDFCTQEQVADALMKIYEMTPEDKEKMKEKVLEYCEHEYSYSKMIEEWDRTMMSSIEKYKDDKQNKKPRWSCYRIAPTMITQPVVPEQTMQDALQHVAQNMDSVEKKTIDADIKAKLKPVKFARKNK